MILTKSGERFYYDAPHLGEYDIEDIAHSLSMTCRFNGHCTKFYSVAEHSYHASHVIDKDFALHALMHDATEAYIGDLPTPLKKRFFGVKILEERIAHCIYMKHFGGPWTRLQEEVVKSVDTQMLRVEAETFWGPELADEFTTVEPADVKIQCWGPEKANLMFLARFAELTGKQVLTKKSK